MANRKRVFSALEVLSAIAESEDEQITSSGSSYHPPESELQDVEDLSSSDSDLVLENNKPVEKNTRLSRKRIRDPDNWKQNVRKRYRNAGREYISRNGKKVPEKVFDEYICCCRLKCGDRIGLENKRAIFNHFYDLDWEGQTQFIASSVQVVQIKSRTVQRPEKSRRQSSRIYYLTDERIRVCKNTFLHTLSVTNKRVDYAVRFKTVPGTTLVTPDQRGKKVPSNKTSDSMIDSIKEHISSFPKFCSHYGRSESSRNYLDPQLSLTRMYELYCEDCKKNMRKPASKWVYSNIFDREYNLHFYKLKKDTCKTCDRTNNSIKYMPDGKEREELVKTLEDHQKRGKQAHEKLKEDIGKANNNQQYKVFTFDLERTLPTPYLNTNEVFYLRQLWVYNLGIHEYPENQAIMNMWDECQAGRGPEDIASCIRSYLESHLSDNNSHVTTYSDSCGGQNRNYPMARFMMHTVNTLKNLQQIDMKFMESGHSFLPNDSDFSHVSNLLKKTTHIFSLKEWEELVSKSNKTRPFIVNHMDGKFYSWKDLDRILINRKKNENSENVKWLQIKWLRFCRGSLKMLYKTSLDDTTEFECVDFCRNKRAFDASLAKFCAFSPRFAYLNRRPIKLQKYTDLQKLLKYIPPIHHEFFINLPHEQAEDDHFPHPDIMSDEYEGED